MTLKYRTFLIVILFLSLPLTGCRGKLFAARPITSLKNSSLIVANHEPDTLRRRGLTSSTNEIASFAPRDPLEAPTSAKEERLLEPRGGQAAPGERFIEPPAEKPGKEARLLDPHGGEKLADLDRFVEPRPEKPGKEEGKAQPSEKLVKEEGPRPEPVIEKHDKERAEKPHKDKK